MYKRDNIYYEEEDIENLLKKEERQANKISKLFNIPLLKYDMKFDGNDITEIIEWIGW